MSLMNFVKSFNMFGTDAMQIPCITGTGAPTTSTAGAVGMLYMDTSSSDGELWKCTGVNNDIYTWIRLINGISNTGVLYTEQKLTEEQQEQARTNIGAISLDEVEELLGIEEEFSATGELVEFDFNIEPETALEVISKIHRDETWGESNKLVLHQVSGSNFVDMSSWLGGVGTVFSKNGLTATVNADSTVTISGTNESDSSTGIIDKYNWSGDESAKVYPAGTYRVPKDFTMAVRSAQYPKNVAISGVGNLNNTVTIPEPFRIIWMRYGVGAGKTVDVTLPIGLFRGNTVPETGYEYSGVLHTVTFDHSVYEGEFNWSTGELKDVDGNTVGYYDVPEIKSLPGTNYFWTGFGENTVSNAPSNLGKVILRMNESAPEETVSSICDFMLTPKTVIAAYSLYSNRFVGVNAKFGKQEVPVLTTKGVLSIKDGNGEVKYSKYIDPIFNTRGVADVLTHKGLEKKWSDKFYLTKDPVSVTHVPPPYTGMIDNYIFVWEFDESEFVNSGIPAKIHDIPMASPCFINNDKSESRITGYSEIWNGTPYPAFFSYNAETGKYTLSAKGIQGGSIKHQLTVYSKVHFYYQLETSYKLPFNFAMGIDAGDQISFEVDLTDNQPYIDDGGVYNTSGGNNSTDLSVDPTITAFVPRSVEDAMSGMSNAARLLNADNSVGGGDATVQGYSWIGAGDGVTDYTVQIQSKLDELHSISNGGIIHLGPGTYPISSSLIVYGNTQIIGDGRTVIEQRSDNTHAVVWSGSNIRMQDLTIRLAGACTELTGCIYTNNNNTSNGTRDERYPENIAVQYCSISNVTLRGGYGFSWADGYPYLSEEALAYRGVGINVRNDRNLYFNFFDADRLTCRDLYVGVYGGGGACNYRMYFTECRYGVYGGGGQSIFELIGHSHYDYGKDGKRILGSEYAYYGTTSDNNTITVNFYDAQFARGVIYFEGRCKDNRYTTSPSSSGYSSGSTRQWGEYDFSAVTDYGRGNNRIQLYNERLVGIGSYLQTISGLPYWNTQFNPSINNALSGAGIWGSITSNIEWSSPNGIGLSDVCRYPKETNKTYFGLASVVSSVSPSEESPIEIIIDISNRPVACYDGFWIQFNHLRVAEEFTVHFDTTNDGTFNHEAGIIHGNIDQVSCKLNYQEPSLMVYRIKISITKALQIPEFVYEDANYVKNTIDYNPEGLVGIVNIGMPSNEAYGRAFLGECGGNIYGNVDMHQNMLKNLPDPVDAGDAVSKSYVDAHVNGITNAEIDELLALIQ